MTDTRRNITENFTIDDAAHSERAIFMKIDNTMPDIYFGNAQNLARYVLEPILHYFGVPFKPQSWYRCERLNTLVGGSKTSDHMIGAAADITIKTVSDMALAEYIRDNLQFDQLIFEPSWIHVSYKKDNNRNEVLRHQGEAYLPGLI